MNNPTPPLSAAAGQALRQCSEQARRGGKHLTFALGAEEYGLPVLRVREIIRYVHVTPVPQAAAHVKGVINLRGQVIAVTDLRSRFGMASVETSERTCIIVVETVRGSRIAKAGLLVDSVCDVVDISDEEVEPAPPLGAAVPAAFIRGIARTAAAPAAADVQGASNHGSVKVLLDVDHLLLTTEAA